MTAIAGLFYIASALLVIAGFLKIRHPQPTARALSMLGLGPSPIAAVLVGAAEIGIGLAALATGSRTTAAAVALVYLGFTGFVAVMLRRPDRIEDCGCFGDVRTPPAPIHLVINLVFASAAMMAAPTPPGGVVTILDMGLRAAAHILLAGLVLYLVYVAATALPTVLGLVGTAPSAPASVPASGLAASLVARGSDFVEGHISRRGFLTGAAVAGAAVVVQPIDFILRPVSAYAAICGCSGSDCDCNDLCCDGYTEFCCTMTGDNLCPEGSVAAGWWKADGPGLCDRGGTPQPRYYIDCNSTCEGCECDESGFCGTECSGCNCECANGECTNRKACCTKFRYGQCAQDLPCVGPIVCRVVTCTAPWFWDPSCTTVLATDNQTRFHDAACLHETINGVPDGIPVVGDWNGDGVQTPGIVKNGRWYLRNSNSLGPADIVFDFGTGSDYPIVGDWTGDGIDKPGVVRNGVWFLKFDHLGGAADLELAMEFPDGIPIAGDWTGDGVAKPGVVRGGTWFLRNSLTAGPADTVFYFGQPGDRPVVGDWNGQGVDLPGVVRNGIWYLRLSHSEGVADEQFAYGLRTDIPIAGHWSAGGFAAPGVVRANQWLLHNEFSTAGADNSFVYGSGALEPV